MIGNDSTVETDELALLRRRVAQMEQEIETLTRQTELLSTREQQYRGLLDSLPVLIWFKDTRNNLLWASQGVLNMMGVPLEAVAGKSCYELYPPDQAEAYYADDLDVIRSGTRKTGIAEPHTAGGELHWMQTTKAAYRNDSGEIVGVTVVAEDVTERKRAEAALHEAERRLQTVIENVPIVLFATDPDGALTLFEGRALADLGIKPSDVVGNSMFSIYHDEPAMRENIGAVLAGEQRTWIIRTAGKVYEYQATPLRGQGGERMGLIGVAVDVTMREKAEETLRHSMIQEELIRAQAATLAELSTPLIPLSDRIMVMPIIGSVDTQRTQQMLETLLNGIAEHRAEVAIIDITGVPIVDTQVANGIVRAAQAGQLLGATIMLTGIRPEVAQTLVGLGVDIQHIITHSSLQSGIAFAIRQHAQARRS